MSINEFALRCAVFDWLFEYSDDHRVYMRGLEEYRALRALASDDADMRALFLFKLRQHEGV